VAKLGPHVASLGLRFYTGKMFPAEYRNNLFIAEHGSWNRIKKSGYNITRVQLGPKGRCGQDRGVPERHPPGR
jgi:glucose/arabinose dehydrogenase